MPRIFRVVSLLAVALFAVTLTGLAVHMEPPAHAKPLFQGAQIDKATLALFQRACQNCHSQNTQWPWYSRIPPVSWMIRKDVYEARRHVDFSKWISYFPEQREDFLTRIGLAVRTGRMPLPRYTLLHREAVLATQERLQIYEWSRAEKKRLRAADVRTSSSAIDTPSAQSSRAGAFSIDAGCSDVVRSSFLLFLDRRNTAVDTTKVVAPRPASSGSKKTFHFVIGPTVFIRHSVE
jgi:hypothetical protein